ncbi:MAG TPA: hypothetical protein EYQ81_06105 [Sneathiellales bacterium]|nr:hypothetical protein [Sneathiellales bacterium]
MAEENGAQLQPTVIKKIKKGGGAHGHSNAWKVAYADFVAAMMAFFMLLWLLNVTTEEQKSGVADYFAPTTASTSKRGSGSARMNPFARQLLTEVSKIINNLPNQLAISGHTDAGAVPVRRGYGNWELSADRANTSRIVLEETGIDELRMNSITGRAATELLVIEDPFSPANRRISIVLLREANVLPPKYHRDMDYANGRGW